MGIRRGENPEQREIAATCVKMLACPEILCYRISKRPKTFVFCGKNANPPVEVFFKRLIAVISFLPAWRLSVQ